MPRTLGVGEPYRSNRLTRVALSLRRPVVHGLRSNAVAAGSFAHAYDAKRKTVSSRRRQFASEDFRMRH